MSLIRDIKIELAKEIYKLEEENLGWKHRTSIDEFARRCINGIGRTKPMSKKDLQNRLDYLKKSEYQKLSESFIREFQDEVNRNCNSANQELSESFIRKFYKRV